MQTERSLWQEEEIAAAGDALTDDCRVKGQSFTVDLVRILKAAFDPYAVSRSPAMSTEQGISPRVPDTYERKKLSLQFKPDIEKIWEDLERVGGWAARAGYDLRTLGILIQHLLIGEFHLNEDIPGEGLLRFEQEEVRTMGLLEAAPEQEREAFHALRHAWLTSYGDKEKAEYRLAEVIAGVPALHAAYLRRFGGLFLERNRWLLRCDDLSLQIDIKTQYPELSREAVELKAAQAAQIHAGMEDFDSLESRYQEALYYGGMGEPTAEDRDRYREERHKLTLKIKFLIHSDRIKHHPNYEKLSAEDRDFLENLLRALPSKNGADAVSSRIFCGYDLDSAEGLVSALSRANAILENAGIKDLKTDILIQGEDLKERQHFLEQETFRLRKANQMMRAQLEGHLQHKSRIMDALNRPEGEKALLEEQIRSFQQTASILTEELDGLFGDISSKAIEPHDQEV
jgi:hypothetical protein